VSDSEVGGRRDRKERVAGLDTPRTRNGPRLPFRRDADPERFGRGAERFARFMGTARFLVYMTAFVTVWLAWNTLAPVEAQWDKAALNYTLLTLILSLQASYAAPLILLAQNRQDDRDRVQNAQDRVATERALADTEFLTREVADLKIALREVATRDFLRSELRTLLEELLERQDETGGDADAEPRERSREQKRSKGKDRDKRDKQRPEALRGQGGRSGAPEASTGPRSPTGPAAPASPSGSTSRSGWTSRWSASRARSTCPGPVPVLGLTVPRTGSATTTGTTGPVTGVLDRPHPQGLQTHP
jgi:uncharacterized membrane protein